MKPELLKLMSLEGNEERQLAYQVAQRIRNAKELFRLSAQVKEDSPRLRQLFERWESACNIVGLEVCIAENPSEFLKLVVKALDGKPSKSDLKPVGLDIIKAWWTAYGIAGRTGNGFNPFASPTLFEVKRQYVRLFCNREKRPDDRTEQQWFLDLQVDKKLPPDPSFRKTLKSVKLTLRKDAVGAPKGSKNTVTARGNS